VDSFSRNGHGFLGPSHTIAVFKNARWKCTAYNIERIKLVTACKNAKQRLHDVYYAVRFQMAFLKHGENTVNLRFHHASKLLGPKNPCPFRENYPHCVSTRCVKKEVRIYQMDEISIHFTKRARTLNGCEIYIEFISFFIIMFVVWVHSINIYYQSWYLI